MIRQRFIGGMLLVIIAILCRDFVEKVVLYEPLAEVTNIEKSAPENPAVQLDFVPAWGPEILADNLFSPGRMAPSPKPEPKPPAPVQQPAPKPPKPDLTLCGIIVDQDGKRTALVQKNNARAVSLKQGDDYEGVTVLAINDRKVSLLWFEETFELSLKNIIPLDSPRSERHLLPKRRLPERLRRPRTPQAAQQSGRPLPRPLRDESPRDLLQPGGAMDSRAKAR
jgi:hypothetical protein